MDPDRPGQSTGQWQSDSACSTAARHWLKIFTFRRSIMSTFSLRRKCRKSQHYVYESKDTWQNLRLVFRIGVYKPWFQASFSCFIYIYMWHVLLPLSIYCSWILYCLPIKNIVFSYTLVFYISCIFMKPYKILQWTDIPGLLKSMSVFRAKYIYKHRKIYPSSGQTYRKRLSKSFSGNRNSIQETSSEPLAAG